MEKLEFRSEAEKEIFMQLISKKEAIRLCFEQKRQFLYGKRSAEIR